MTWTKDKEEIARQVVRMLYQNGMIRTFYRDKPEGWTLISGLYSPMYIQLRPLVSYPEAFEAVCRAMARMLKEEAPEITKIIGIAMAGVPLAAGIAVCGGIPAGFTRKMENVKSPEAFRKVIEGYGEHALLEGELQDSDKVALVDDLVTRFDSKLVAREQTEYEIRRRNLSDIECKTVAVVLDREQGGAQSAKQHGMTLLSLIPFRRLGLPLLKEVMHEVEYKALERYLDDPEYFQSKEAQEELRESASRV